MYFYIHIMDIEMSPTILTHCCAVIATFIKWPNVREPSYGK